MPLEHSQVGMPPRGHGTVVAVFSYRYDAHLVPGLIENIGPAVQGWIAWDDRTATGALGDEPARRRALVEAARGAGADWIFAVDPDERFEASLAERMRDMTRRHRSPALWTFQVCDLFAPEAWRADGLWGGKRVMRLFPAAVADPSAAAFHGGWVGRAAGLPHRSSQVRLYHLRMATPERRRHRRDTYASADPDRRFQAIGYDYLADETGQVLRAIEPERRFHPPFVEDGGLWAPAPDDLAPAPPDPPDVRLRFIEAARRRAGAGGTLRLATRLARPQGPDRDVDLLGLAGQLALEARRPARVRALLDPGLDEAGADPRGTPFLRFVRAQARLRLGDRAGADSDLALLRRLIPNAPVLQRLARHARGPGRLDAPRAAWRRWTGPGADLHEGPEMVRSAAMAVVVIGFRAPPELAEAVASVLEQDVPAEVVVVNTGGGDARGVLAPYLDRIRLITCERPLYVGAARNIGIDASRARLVAFLAADCRALPGWVAGRLARHRAGAAAVGNPVVPDRPGNVISRAINIATHHRRHPRTPEDEALRFGVSYARWLFLEFGYFPPGLRVGEDSVFNALVAGRHAIDWAPEVLTTHRYPTNPVWLLRDQFARGFRRGAQPSHVAGGSRARRLAEIRAEARERVDTALAAARRLGAPGRMEALAMRMLLRVASWADAAGALAALRQRSRAERARHEATAVLARDPASAVRHLREALALNREDVDLRLDLAAALVASGRLRDLRQARRACLEAAAIAPAAPGPVNRLCDRLEQRGRPGRALAEAEAAVARSPATAQFWAKASTLAFREGDLVRALFYGQGALALGPTTAYAHHRLARIYGRLGWRARAGRRARWATLLEPPS